MDIEHLTKSQLILLTLMVSFVTSIATGIVTVSLMQQAPPTVAQTVNRVIERTIEKVTPSNTAAVSGAIQTKTVVVPATELVAQAVAKVTPSVVRVYSNEGATPTFLALGIALDGGTVVTDADALGQIADTNTRLVDGTDVRMFVTRRDTAAHLAFLTFATTTKGVTLTPATLSGKTPDLGIRVVTLSGESVFRIGDGLLSAVAPGKQDHGTYFDTTIPDTVIVPGSPLFNENGAVIGISTGVSRASSSSGFVPAAALVAPPAETKEKAAQ